MIRALFFQEFVKKFVTELSFVSIAAFLWVVIKSLTSGSFQNAAAQEIFDALQLAAMLLIAASAGSGTFSRLFREGPMRLLEVLPVERRWIWSVRLFTSLATAMAGIAVFLLLDPSLVTRYDFDYVVLMTGLALLLFAAGCCLSTLVSASTTVLTALNATVSFLVLFVLVVVEEYIITGGTDEKGFIVGAAMGALFLPVFLCLSLAVFIRGELDTPRRRWRNGMFGIAVVLGTLIFSTAAVDAGVFETGSPWKTERIAVSRDAAYVATVQIKGTYSPAFRVVIVDTTTGNVGTTYYGSGCAGGGWTHDDTFIVFCRASALNYLFHLGSESFDAIRIYPTEQHLLRKTKARFMSSAHDRRGTLIYFEDAPSFGVTLAGKVLRMDSSGQTRQLLNVPKPLSRGWSRVVETFDEGLAFIDTQRWLIREDITELPYDFGHFRIASRKEMEEVSTRLKNNPPRAGTVLLPGKYLTGDSSVDFDDSIWLYYLQPDTKTASGRLWARRNDGTEWKEVLKDIRLSDLQMKELWDQQHGLFTRETYPAIRAGTRNGVVAHLSTIGKQTRLLVMDLNSGERFDLGEMNIPGEHVLRVLFPTEAPLRSVIHVSRLNNSFRSFSFYYEPGSGPPVLLIQPDQRRSLVYAGKGGAHVYIHMELPLKLFYAKPPEPPRELRNAAP
jgi:hypothetical protein